MSNYTDRETRYLEFLEHTTDAYTFFEVVGGRRFLLEAVNSAAERLLGISEINCSGKSLQELFPPSVREQVQRAFLRAVETPGNSTTEQCWCLPEGDRWVQGSLVSIRHPGQVPHRLVAVWRDITDQKCYEQALLDREEMFRRLVETTNVIPWEADFTTRRFTYVGPQAVRRFGYPQFEWLSEGFWAKHIHPDERDLVVEICNRLSTVQNEFEFEYRMLTQSGDVVWVHDLVNVAVDRDGSLCLRGFMVDVTANREAEQEVRRLNAELERRVVERTAQLEAANRELEAFCYSVSHDLRAPLRAIDGFSKALLEDYLDRLDEEGRDMLRRVRAGSQRMGDLIDDLLSLSRVTRSEMRTTTVNLSDLAHTIATNLEQSAPHRRVEWRIEPNLTAVADRALVTVVLENLLGNAWKYTVKQPYARIEFGRENDEFFVRDNGAGFDPTYAGKLFQPFQRLHAVEEFEGHGIGLATVQRIIHRHQGHIRAEGTVGKGAAFYFTLSPTSP